jgi:hypothetical protein
LGFLSDPRRAKKADKLNSRKAEKQRSRNSGKAGIKKKD